MTKIQNKTIPPKLFISYSWSSVDHQKWVLQLATELRESGVDVILDKWDLKEGHDAIAFMEKMVTDKTIKKVLMISDKTYAEKSAGRMGGVGTETQIISPNIYEQQEQEKFVAAVTEKDDDNKAYLPTYYNSRMYIDFTESEKYTENFEQLLRWIFDQPLYSKPEIGKKPAFLNETESISLGVSATQRRAILAIKESKPYSSGAISEYFSSVTDTFAKFKITETEVPFDEALIKNIELFIPSRDEIVQVFLTIAQYAPSDDNIQQIHRFFESLLLYFVRSTSTLSLPEHELENFKFLIHELFLYAIAVLLKFERFTQVNSLLTHQYFVPDNDITERTNIFSFLKFRPFLGSLENRNNRLKLNRLSLHSDLLKERANQSVIKFEHLMQADFVLYLRGERRIQNQWDNMWWPHTLLYAYHRYQPFEIFTRSISISYFERIKCLLDIDTVEQFKEWCQPYLLNSTRVPKWQFDRIDLAVLIGLDLLGTQP